MCAKQILTLNQEADEIAYRCAFACQKTKYLIVSKHKDTRYETSLCKTKIIEALKRRGKLLDIDYSLYPVVEPEPEKQVAYTLKAMLKSLYHVHENITIKDINLFVSPSRESNFRYSIAKTPGPNGEGYKAGRAEKPYHLQFIRDLLISKYNAEIVEGFEADDALGFYQTEKTIASHIDKDINMIPGMHYNHVERIFYRVTEFGHLELTEKRKLKLYGLMGFYAQLLMGDRTDNIPGVPRCGPVAVYNLLNDAVEEDDLMEIVFGVYNKNFGADALSRLAEVADLLWICRRKDETGRQYLAKRGYL